MSGGSLASGEEKISLKTGVHSAGYQSSGSMSNEEGNGSKCRPTVYMQHVVRAIRLR